MLFFCSRCTFCARFFWRFVATPCLGDAPPTQAHPACPCRAPKATPLRVRTKDVMLIAVLGCWSVFAWVAPIPRSFQLGPLWGLPFFLVAFFSFCVGGVFVRLDARLATQPACLPPVPHPTSDVGLSLFHSIVYLARVCKPGPLSAVVASPLCSAVWVCVWAFGKGLVA